MNIYCVEYLSSLSWIVKHEDFVRFMTPLVLWDSSLYSKYGIFHTYFFIPDPQFTNNISLMNCFCVLQTVGLMTSWILCRNVATIDEVQSLRLSSILRFYLPMNKSLGTSVFCHSLPTCFLDWRVIFWGLPTLEIVIVSWTRSSLGW